MFTIAVLMFLAALFCVIVHVEESRKSKCIRCGNAPKTPIGNLCKGCVDHEHVWCGQLERRATMRYRWEREGSRFFPDSFQGTVK